MGVSTVLQGIGLGLNIVGGINSRNAAEKSDWLNRISSARGLEYEAWGQEQAGELQARGLESEIVAALEKAAASEANVTAQLKEAQWDEMIGRYNQASAEADARAVETALDHSLALHARNVDQIVSAQKVSYAKGGVAVDEGTPIAVAATTYLQAADDSQAMIEAGASQAARYRSQGELALMESGLLADKARSQAALDRMMTYSLLRSAGSLADLADFTRATSKAGAAYLRDSTGVLIGAEDDETRKSILGSPDEFLPDPSSWTGLATAF